MTRLTPFRKRLADRLSGGMKQKLALACTLVHQPELVVLDEPTTGVDPVSRREFWKLLSEFLARGVTIVMSTPYLDEAERCTRVALMHEGQVLAADQPGRLRAQLSGGMVEVVASGAATALDAVRALPGVADAQAFGDRLHVRLERRRRGGCRCLHRDAATRAAARRPGPRRRGVARGRVHRHARAEGAGPCVAGLDWRSPPPASLGDARARARPGAAGAAAVVGGGSRAGARNQPSPRRGARSRGGDAGGRRRARGRGPPARERERRLHADQSRAGVRGARAPAGRSDADPLPRRARQLPDPPGRAVADLHRRPHRRAGTRRARGSRSGDCRDGGGARRPAARGVARLLGGGDRPRHRDRARAGAGPGPTPTWPTRAPG